MLRVLRHRNRFDFRSIMFNGKVLTLEKQTIVVSKLVSGVTITYCLSWAQDPETTFSALFDLFLGLIAFGGPGGPAPPSYSASYGFHARSHAISPV